MGQIIDPVTCSHRFKHGPICPGQFDHFDPVGFGGAKGCNGHVSAEFAGFKGLGVRVPGLSAVADVLGVGLGFMCSGGRLSHQNMSPFELVNSGKPTQIIRCRVLQVR